ncbi:MAG TPA: ABC transporter permease [Bacteroidia bacterium]|nr:ABC transporter permease [Bacteroidia bacterium]
MTFPDSIKNTLVEINETARFALRFFREVFIPPYEFKEVIRQGYEVGYKSIPLVGTTAFIMGLVVTMQSRPTLVEFGAGAWLPAMAAVGIVREIGPVVTALMCAGKVGSNIGAELGSMKVTEQLDAMEVSGTNPFKFVVVTRILATTLMIPILVVFADTLSLFGSFVAANIKGHISFYLFCSQVFEKLVFMDVIPSISKSFFFGFIIGLISCYQGYNSKKGTEGVGKSANAAVVISSLLVFIIDLMAVQITNIFMKY